MPAPTPSRSTSSGGFLIALGALGGAAIGFVTGEVTAGFLIGLGLGVAAAILIWLVDRRR